MILANLKKGLTPLQFLMLRSGDLAFFQYVFPTIGAAACVVILWLLSDWVTVDYRSMVSSLNSFIGILIGFYIASLAAVTSFPSNSLDSLMKGDTPSLKKTVGGKKIVEKLTRRRFLSILFGYCSLISILIYILGFIWLGVQINGAVPVWIGRANELVRWPFLAFYSWLGFSLVTTTLLALHYLIDRVHRD